MSIVKSTSKKRKRDASPEAQFELADPPTGKVGPLLVSYPALQAPPSTSFKCYTRKKIRHASNDDSGENWLVVGETPAVEFVTNEDESQKAADLGCRYLLAMRNKKTGRISLLPAVQSPHILTHTVKALKSISASAVPSKVQYLEAKTALGETFGTKKQKASIKAQERNKIDVSAMQGVMGYVMDSIEKGAGNLMTEKERKDAADKNRLIPPFSADTTDPSDIYPLHDIISESEWKALAVSPFEAAESHKERVALLPYRKSEWVNGRLEALFKDNGSEKNKKKNLKILIYVSAMLSFRQAAFQKSIEKEKLYERLVAVPSLVADSLLSRFTEVARGSSNNQMTSATKTSLLTHIFALCLKVDNYATNTALVAHDLSLPVPEVNQLFRSLGCKIQKLGERERARLGISSTSVDEKRAVLTAPVEFPKPRLRKK